MTVLDDATVTADAIAGAPTDAAAGDEPATGPRGVAGEHLVRLRTGTGRRAAPLGALRGLLPVLALVAWWWGSSTGRIAPSVLPSPGKVVDTFRAMAADDLWTHLSTSLGRSMRGAAIGITVGLALGGVAGLSKLGERLFDSTLQMLRTVPFLAVVPLLIVWLGIGETPKILLIAAATTFPVYINTYNGVRNVDRRVVEGARSFGLRGPRLVREIMIPLAMPSILTGIRFALGVSILALLAAEQINASSGLGYLLYTAQVYQRVDILMVVVLIYAALGLGVDLVVRALERLVMPWRAGVSAR